MSFVLLKQKLIVGKSKISCEYKFHNDDSMLTTYTKKL